MAVGNIDILFFFPPSALFSTDALFLAADPEPEVVSAIPNQTSAAQQATTDPAFKESEPHVILSPSLRKEIQNGIYRTNYKTDIYFRMNRLKKFTGILEA